MREKQIKRSPKSQKFEVFDHFLNGSTTGGAFFSPFNFQSTFTGTGAAIQNLAGDGANSGILRLLTGTVQTQGSATNAGSRTGLSTNTSNLISGGADIELEFLFRPTVLAASGNDYEYWLGFGERGSGSMGVPNSGAYIYFDYANAGGARIQCTTKSLVTGAGTTALSNTSQSLNWTKCNIKLLKTGTSAIFTFNDTDAVTISANIPATTGIQFVMSKYEGTTNEGLDLDYIKFAWSR